MGSVAADTARTLPMPRRPLPKNWALNQVEVLGEPQRVMTAHRATYARCSDSPRGVLPKTTAEKLPMRAFAGYLVLASPRAALRHFSGYHRSDRMSPRSRSY